MVQFLKVPVYGNKKDLWQELFKFQTSFNCDSLELLRTTP